MTMGAMLGRAVLLLGVPLLMFNTGHWLLGLGVWAVYGLFYAYSLGGLPDVPCWWCGGSGARGHWGITRWLFPWATGDCRVCHGDKVRVRWGVRFFAPQRAARLRARGAASESKSKSPARTH